MKRSIIKAGIFGLLSTVFCLRSTGQLSLAGQIRTRTEFRDGQGAPLPKKSDPAFFISQRTRLSASFNAYRLKLGVSIQDVRVWGQDVSTINSVSVPQNNGLMFHEAWAEIQLTDSSMKEKSLNLKIGRQELVYDDQRLLGNLDWLQQARRHDAALLKYRQNTWTMHLGAAFNQNKEKGSGTIYNSVPPGNYGASTNGGTMYKSLEFIYVGKKLPHGNASFLFLSGQFNKFSMETIDNATVKTYQAGAWSRATTGFYFNNLFNKLEITGSLYYQFGKNALGQSIRGEMITLGTRYSFGRLNIGPGIDYTSGGVKGNIGRNFDPLYGTPHKFWGHMDYFYAGSAFGKGGLMDYNLKSRMSVSDRLIVSADFHHFTSASEIQGSGTGVNSKRQLGQEIDIGGLYDITKQINLEVGYAHYFSTPQLSSASVKNVPDARPGANWAYLMINIKPAFLLK